MSVIDKIDKITEGTTLSDSVAFDKLIKKIAGMTDRNDHTGARVLISSSILKNKKLVKIFEAIEEIQNVEGHLPHNLGKYSYEKYEEMMKLAKKELEPIRYSRLHDSL